MDYTILDEIGIPDKKAEVAFRIEDRFFHDLRIDPSIAPFIVEDTLGVRQALFSHLLRDNKNWPGEPIDDNQVPLVAWGNP